MALAVSTYRRYSDADRDDYLCGDTLTMKIILLALLISSCAHKKHINPFDACKKLMVKNQIPVCNHDLFEDKNISDYDFGWNLGHRSGYGSGCIDYIIEQNDKGWE